MTPEESLRKGVKILDLIMIPNGFKFEFIENGQGSGGKFSFGRYIKDDRTLELYYRYGLGNVSYQIGEYRLVHEDYIKLLGVYGHNKYPGFSEERFLAFEDLLYDLKNFASDFLNGTGEQFKRLAEVFQNKPDMFKGFRFLTRKDS